MCALCVCVCVCVCVLVLAPTADKHQHSVLLSCIPTITGPPVESITQGMGVLMSPRTSNTTNNTTNSTSLVIYDPSPEEQAWMEEQIDQQGDVLHFPSAGSPAYCKLRAEGSREGQHQQLRELARTWSNGSTTTETVRSPRPDNSSPSQRQRPDPAGMCALCSCVVA